MTRKQLNKIGTIVRFHKFSDTLRLKTALYCLYSQKDVEVEPIVVLQRPTEAQESEVKDICRQVAEVFRGDYVIISLSDERGDLRTVMLNSGLDHIKSDPSYDAFGVLDYDDLLLTHAYSLLSSRLSYTESAMAFGRVWMRDCLPFKYSDYVYDIKNVYNQTSKFELLKDNFCPIHSYLFNLRAIDPDDLWFDDKLTRLEDYDLVLRIISKYKTDFTAIDNMIGLYSVFADGSNTTLFGFDTAEEGAAKLKSWAQCQAALIKRKSELPVRLWASDF